MILDKNMIARTVRLLHGGKPFEVRYIKRGKIYSGYYNAPDELIRNLEYQDDDGNVYLTIQGINDSCFCREQQNKLIQAKTTTSDKDILTYRFLMIDLDPERTSGISSTDAEMKAAHAVAKSIYSYLDIMGFASPLVAMSGNGWHLLYRIALENNEENVKLVQNCLETLDMLFSNDRVKVDTGVFNPSRICKLYGTVSHKGANAPERPHRMSYIATPKDDKPLEITPKAKLLELVANLPVKEIPARTSYDGQETRKCDDLGEWLNRYNVPVREVKHTGGITKYVLECCPFDSSHGGKDAAVFQMPDGSFGFRCFHDSCSGKHWKDFRLVYEPDAYNFGTPDVSLKPNHTTADYAPQTMTKWDKIVYLKTTADSSEPKFYTLSDILALTQKPEEYIFTGIEELDSSLGGLKKGLVTCISGMRGSGKSSLLSQIVLHAAVKENARALMFSGELTARTAADWFFRQAAGKDPKEGVQKYGKFDNKYYVPDPTKKKIADMVADKVYIYNNSYGNNYETVLGEMCRIQEDKQVDLILLDNLMSLDIRTADMNDKYNAQSRFIEQLEIFAKEANVHIIFVAHPRKAIGFLRLDDISGSGDIANRVDNAMIIHRRNNDFKRLSKQMFGWKDDNPLYASNVGNVLEICKDRENGTQDKFIPLYFDIATKRLKNSDNENIDYLEGDSNGTDI